KESAFLVHRFLHGMKEPYKEVFSLRVFGELSFKKMALLFGKTPSWARVTFYRAKKQIVSYMEEIENGKN
ncbi:MAG: sigma factor-like helix-turn-helix DNA-binding protein, partial [Desulfitobacteriaceae bacterium]|nr:sigma factor-like helix-turn-helix DNA-binding protein [Desulfitobacteriaceae bacterium]